MKNRQRQGSEGTGTTGDDLGHRGGTWQCLEILLVATPWEGGTTNISWVEATVAAKRMLE